MEIKTSWEIREYVEESLPQIAKDCEIGWSEAHFDIFGKGYDELHKRDSKKWVALDDLEKALDNVEISLKDLEI